eukprot:1158225-Pelagomonas_calceolata.AAC.4
MRFKRSVALLLTDSYTTSGVAKRAESRNDKTCCLRHQALLSTSSAERLITKQQWPAYWHSRRPGKQQQEPVMPQQGPYQTISQHMCAHLICTHASAWPPLQT